MRRIYFDHAASTPLDKTVWQAMKPYFSKFYGNAAATHQFGQEVQVAIGQARKTIADFFYCQPEEIIFTSGATEANNLGVKGILEFYQAQFNIKNKFASPHMITSTLEHPSVLESALTMQSKGCQLSLVKPKSAGVVAALDILKEIKPETVLISLMYVNNEVGTIQPIQTVGKELAKINKQREKDNLPKIYFQVDAAQGLDYLNCRPDHLAADLIAFSGHKIYGPKGIGLLYVRDKTPLKKQMDGGHQERARRAGTLNTPGIIGMAEAIKLIDHNQDSYINKVGKLKDRLMKGLEKIAGLHFNGQAGQTIPSIINIRIDNILAENLHMKLDLSGVATSVGAACASGAAVLSSTLIAMGLTSDQARASLRLSLGHDNNLSEIDKFILILNQSITDLQHAN